jgi:hypothetical protein
LAEQEGSYAYCSANGRFDLDPFPQRLKPDPINSTSGAAEAAPFQDADTERAR